MIRARTLRLLASLALACAVVLAPHAAGAARAEPPVATRNLGIRWNAQAPVLSFSARDFLTADVRKKLGSGLPQRIVTRVYAYTERGEKPIALTATACRVVYDLWEGVYRVEEQTAHSDKTRNERSVDAAVHACLDVQSITVGAAEQYAKYHGQRVYFGVIIELNPLSADTVQRIRRWLSRSGGAQLAGDAFFGSFVSIFVSREMGAAERTLTFRSRSIDVP